MRDLVSIYKGCRLIENLKLPGAVAVNYTKNRPEDNKPTYF